MCEVPDHKHMKTLIYFWGSTKGFVPSQAVYEKSDNGFAWISAHHLLEPLLNMHASFYMSVITYLNTKGHPSNP